MPAKKHGSGNEEDCGVRPDRGDLARRHAGLVMSLARRFAGRAELVDLYQAGCVGLLRAIDRFDPERGSAFSTYAAPLIVSEMISYLRGLGPVHLPRPVRELAIRCRRAQDALRSELLREPTISEISLMVGADPADVAWAMESGSSVASIDERVSGADNSLPLIDVIPGSQSHEQAIVESASLHSAISGLADIQQTVIRMRYFEQLTQVQVAHALGISQPKAHRLEKAALMALRRSIDAE
ncbi:MAG: sigma-70 family RNA polymerase sigma factor [Clostridia bacterium]|nr:sigma-70 family RNA polymerase sigma factor [Clostridia bacterium]